jgi:hypothetical protein
LAPIIPKGKIQKLFGSVEERETDATRIQARLKQIACGKNTLGYDNYTQQVPKKMRRGYAEHPRTPDPTEKISKRCFDGRIKAWRRALHTFDPLYVGDGELEKALEKTSLMGFTANEEGEVQEQGSASKQNSALTEQSPITASVVNDEDVVDYEVDDIDVL